MSAADLSVLFFLQISVILAACRIVGLMAKRLGQPQVVGEMIAGVLLGPSLFGQIAPGLQRALFPPESMPLLLAVSQIGLALYMFLVGMEFRTDLLRPRLRSAMSVSIAGMLAPFALGALLALWLVTDRGRYFTPQVGAFEAALFLGASMCITAFPMLARIIRESGLANTSLGTLALAAGALDDLAAWCLLAVVLSSLSGDWIIAAKAIGGGVAFAVLCRYALKPVLASIARPGAWCGASGQTHVDDGSVDPGLMTLGLVLVLLMFGAWFTDWVGIYAVFGAFIMGVTVPRGPFSAWLDRTLAPVTTVLLLPLFFTYSGLNTRLDLVDSAWLWLVTFIVLLAAVSGKGLACALAARLNGENRRTSAAVGTLMNARGLMELIIINIGIQRGVITPALFSMLVVMAIATTLMATPIFNWIYRGRRDELTPIASVEMGQRAP